MIKLKINSCDGVYDSLDVRFTKACDNNCAFCIEKEGLESLGLTNVSKMISSTISSGKRDILILGGEPLLTPKLTLEYINGIRDHVDKIYLTTSLPKSITTGEGLVHFKEIISLLDGINISVHHYDNEINNKVLKSNNPYDRIHFLEKMLEDEEFANKARICCNLVNNYICNKKEIYTFLIRMASIGVKHVKLNELQNVDANTYVSFEEVYNLKMKSPFAYGCQTDISDFFSEFDMKTTLKRSCFCTKDINLAKASIGDLAKCIIKKINPQSSCSNLKVLYENGEISDGWLQKN